MKFEFVCGLCDECNDRTKVEEKFLESYPELNDRSKFTRGDWEIYDRSFDYWKSELSQPCLRITYSNIIDVVICKNCMDAKFQKGSKTTDDQE
jgi:hypothetical protein